MNATIFFYLCNNDAYSSFVVNKDNDAMTRKRTATKPADNNQIKKKICNTMRWKQADDKNTKDIQPNQTMQTKRKDMQNHSEQTNKQAEKRQVLK